MTQFVGILNLTPDSFSDGGAVGNPLERVGQLIAQGAKVIDIGAESTRPGATPLAAEEEWARLEPVLEPLLFRYRNKVIFSLDTRHAQTAERALALGVSWINDVSAAADARLWQAVAKYPAARYVLMHSLSVPAEPQTHLPEEVDVVEAVTDFFYTHLREIDLPPEQLILDPGIGFGKTAAQSLELIRRIAEFKVFGLPVMVGHSRKSCFAPLIGNVPAAERDGVTLMASLFLARQGVDYLRVHEVGLHSQALGVMYAF